ncbi:response regulator [Hymenobacter sp. ASUV-10]|uniref:Response regulator n=1 Tax=Hymenobacter aranciens TaxID=3063996 RepID=A0ABT9B8U8_9BACT|nr:response regulator [Hymenobacter sp. ASUV-10]MDO7874088.1 response regulator [Hymenobacter sp. ASUV-10]
MLVYLIDEDDISLYLTEQTLILEDFAQQIRAFSTAEEALAALVAQLASHPPQVIFLDLNMPVMDGWEFLAALEPYAAQVLSQCRIYLLTSSLALADTARANTHQLVSGIIHKPLDEGDLRAIRATLAPNPALS